MTTNTELPPLPDFAPVWQHIMTVDGTKRVAAYNALCDMLHAYARAALAQPQQTAPEFARLEALICERDALRHALEVIAVGDSANPVRDAGDELVALGHWRAEALEASRAAPAGQAAAPTLEELELFARDLCRNGKLIWAGFRTDEDGTYSIPSINPSVYKLVCAALQKYSQQAPAAEAAGQAAARVYSPELSSDMRCPYGGQRFSVQDGGKWIDDDDFLFDARLTVSGDFADDSTRLAYAEMIAGLLNAPEQQAPAAEAVQPVTSPEAMAAWVEEREAKLHAAFLGKAEAVQPAQAVRLTDEQQTALVVEASGWERPSSAFFNVARAIERAVWAANNLRGE